MRRLRVLIVVPEFSVPPPDADPSDEKGFVDFKAAYDVGNALGALGHEARQLGLWEDVAPLRHAIEEWRPSIVFNLLDRFRGQTVYDQHLTSFLQLLGVPFTGCNPRGLVIASDKALSKKILHYHRIRVPRFQTFPRGRAVRRAKNLRFPLIVKAHLEEASAGIAQASYVRDDAHLVERVRFVHESFHSAAIVEEYVEGRELSVGVVGNERLQVLPAWELFLDDLPPGVPRIATYRVKWDIDFQDRYKILIAPADALPDEVASGIAQTTRRIYRALGLSGYARIDYRLAEDGRLYFIEANANPDISRNEVFAAEAEEAGIDYEPLVQKILNLGLRWSATF